MKFSCPKCRKQFVLSPKMAGKSLKVRCTACGSVFRMRVGGAAPQEGGEVPAAAEQTGPLAEETTTEVKPVEAERDAVAPVARPSEPVAAPAATVVTSVASAARQAPGRQQGATQPAPEDFQAPGGAVVPSPVRGARPEAKPFRAGGAPAAAHKYFAVVGGKRLGPMPFAALKRLAIERKIGPTALVWRRGLAEWVAASSLNELAGVFDAEPPTIPAGPPPLPSARAEAAKMQPALTLAPAPSPAAEITEEEVGLDQVDHDFFALGSQPQVVERGAESIEILTEPAFPAAGPEMLVEKRASESLRDFSVMVRLSRESRRRSVMLLTGLALVTGLSLVTIFTLGDPLAVIFPEKQQVEYKPQAPSSFLVDLNKGKEAKKVEKKARSEQQAEDDGLGADPEGLVRAMHDQQHFVSLDFEAVGVNKEELAARIQAEKKRRHSDEADGKTVKTSGGMVMGSAEEEEELTLEALALAEKKTASPGEGITGGGPAGTGKHEIAGKIDSAMGSLTGTHKLEERKVTANVAEREGDGVALKALVAKKIARKMGGEKTKLQRCVDAHGGVGGMLRATLHFSEDGTVGRVSVKGGTPALEECVGKLFAGWRVAMVTQKVQVPISVRFE